MATDKSLCVHGRDPEACSVSCLAALLERGANGDRHNRICPCHADSRASLSINPGTKGMRMIWCCGAGCPAKDVRAALESLGADSSCLGRYGLPGRTVVPGVRATGASPGIIADAKRWQAVLKLPADVGGSLLRMCIKAISEGDGDLPGDPYTPLPVNRDDFLALAIRAGIERGYAYRVYRQWMAYG